MTYPSLKFHAKTLSIQRPFTVMSRKMFMGYHGARYNL